MPELTDHLYGRKPPVAWNNWLYGMPMAPVSNGLVVAIVNPAKLATNVRSVEIVNV